MQAYILTREHNDYDQYGEYFVAWFSAKPTAAQIQTAIKRDDDSEIDSQLAAYVLSGGGRQKHENVWWHLRQVTSANSPSDVYSRHPNHSI